MSADRKFDVTRRPMLAGLLAAAGLAIAGTIYEWPRWMRRRYPPTPYDDLLGQLNDRESAAKLGDAVVKQIYAHSDIYVPDLYEKAARELREGPGKGSLVRAAEIDLARGRVVEVQGWVLPISITAIAGLAAGAH